MVSGKIAHFQRYESIGDIADGLEHSAIPGGDAAWDPKKNEVFPAPHALGVLGETTLQWDRMRTNPKS